MKKAGDKKLPKQIGYNRYHYPVSEKRISAGIAGIAGISGIEPGYGLVDNRLYEDTDPLGSYTGVPRDGGQPVQDADDL